MNERDIPVRLVDTNAYMEMIRGLLEEGNEVPMIITGNSMSPFMVHERDRILIRKASFPMKKGDMAFFQRRDGHYVMHRIVRVKDGKYYFVGDAQTWIEGPIDEEQIFGEIISVCRKGKWIGPKDFWWKFFRYIWLNIIPLRPAVRGAYSLFCRLIRKKGN